MNNPLVSRHAAMPASARARGRHAQLAVLSLVVLGFAACDIRDEPVQGPATSGSRWLVPVGTHLENTPRRSGVQRDSFLSIEYVDGYEAGRKRAAAAKKPMLVVFRATWCRWSSEMMQDTLLDDQIVALSQRFVCVLVDADRNADTCRALAVNGFPTVLLITADGEEYSRSTGRPAADRLAKAMHHALDTKWAAGEDNALTR